MTDEILIRYITGQADPIEIKQVRAWASVSGERQKELARMKNIWILGGLENDLDQLIREPEIRRILDQIRLTDGKGRSKKIRLNLLKYAAALLFIIGLSGAAGYFISKRAVPSSGYAAIIVPKGERSKVVLPDGSTVQLNGGSRLTFSPAFQAEKRTVFLEGEAYFDVTHDRLHPFIVETDRLQIKVLGTKFNVSNYPDDQIITTYLEEGKVEITMDGQDDTLLRPFEALEFNRTSGKVSKKVINDNRFSDWTRGVLNINGETIEEFAKKLERRFDIRIVFGDDKIRKRIYSGSIKDESLDTVLEALRFASSLRYEKQGKRVLLYSLK